MNSAEAAVNYAKGLADFCAWCKPIKSESCEVIAEDESGFPVAGFGPKISGVGKDAPTVVNKDGGKQSKTLYRMDLLPARATLGVASVLREGAEKYGDNNWRKISINDHLNHALVHAYSYLAGDRQDDHLSHFACRAMMALEMAHAEL